jgi:NAD(P)-dependent dehydrogenase (short-subunit alcohol dehydrogenase family)
LAGVYAAIVEVSVETIGALLDVNVRGPLLAAQAAIPHLPAGGRIITIGSARAERIVGDTGTIYFMTKSALHSFTRGLARERGSRDVAVNLVQRRSRSLPTKTD